MYMASQQVLVKISNLAKLEFWNFVSKKKICQIGSKQIFTNFFTFCGIFKLFAKLLSKIGTPGFFNFSAKIQHYDLQVDSSHFWRENSNS